MEYCTVSGGVQQLETRVDKTRVSSIKESPGNTSYDTGFFSEEKHGKDTLTARCFPLK